MRSLLKLALFFSVFVLVVAVGNFLLVLSHESAHQQIYSIHGVDSEIRLGLFGSHVAMLEPASIGDREAIASLNAMNEVFSYQAMALFNALALLSFFSIWFFAYVGRGGGCQEA